MNEIFWMIAIGFFLIIFSDKDDPSVLKIGVVLIFLGMGLAMLSGFEHIEKQLKIQDPNYVDWATTMQIEEANDVNEPETVG